MLVYPVRFSRKKWATVEQNLVVNNCETDRTLWFTQHIYKEACVSRVEVPLSSHTKIPQRILDSAKKMLLGES